MIVRPCTAATTRTRLLELFAGPSWKPLRYAAVGGPNQVVSASASPTWARSPTQATESIGDSALIENLDGARVQTARAQADEILADAPLDDSDVDARQRELARKHQSRRTTPGNHHRMFGHRHATPLR